MFGQADIYDEKVVPRRSATLIIVVSRGTGRGGAVGDALNLVGEECHHRDAMLERGRHWGFVCVLHRKKEEESLWGGSMVFS